MPTSIKTNYMHIVILSKIRTLFYILNRFTRKEINSKINNNIETLDNVSNTNIQKEDSNNGEL